MTSILGGVLLLYAASASVYGAVHWRVMARAASIPLRVRWAIAARERVVVPGGLVAAAGALLAIAQGCTAALAVLVVVAALSGILDGAIAVALVAAGRVQGPAIERVHLLAGAGALSGRDLLERLERARSAAELRARQTPEA